MTASIYAEDNSDNEENLSYLDKLVGEGKKFKDHEALARSVWEKDNNYIPRLERENQALREDLNSRTNMEKLIEQLGSRTSTNNQPVEQESQKTPSQTHVVTAGLSKEEIAGLVKNIVTENKTQETRENNIKHAVAELKKMYGNNFVAKLEQLSQDTGLTKEYLDDLAATSPKALLSMVGVPVGQKVDTPPRSSVMSTISTGKPSGTKDWAYYQNLRRTNPNLYHSIEIQREIHNRAISGELVIPSN